ncbi:hypothetical protein D7B24_005581 [Verticillium nonalfalfae]|uniref:Rhodopsin domain-containing protein n=1 Tax=Verticillium nonalfalfae TaxID=1051616 RepID=A0A3M9YDY2_9PEZI|nr:uncharacterized protein D7B24_005581 [Verticillium nonalfalfae]RNJ57788.1 hypothetical protein D7B24_005581 [Verticillium nonalfalfae]
MSESLVPKVVGVASVLIAITTLSVLIRFFVRGCLLRKLDWDDGLVFVSYCLTMVFCSMVLASEHPRLDLDMGMFWLTDRTVTKVGFGSHQYDLSDADVERFFKLQMVTPVTYIWGFVTVKMSFAVLYLRLLPDLLNRRINQGLLVLLMAEGLEESLVVIFHCVPVAKVWDHSLEGTCLDLKPFYYASFVVKFLTDIVLFVQPIPVIWRMQLSKIKRIGAILMLSIGLFVCVISIVRVSYIGAIGRDFTYGIVNPMLWSMVEVSSLIACSCVPSLRPFLRCFPAIDRALGLTSERELRSPYKMGRPPNANSLPLSQRSKYNRPRTGVQKPVQFGLQMGSGSAVSRSASSEATRTSADQGHGGITDTAGVEVVVEMIEDAHLAAGWRSPGAGGDEVELVGALQDDTRDSLEFRHQDTSWLSMRL